MVFLGFLFVLIVGASLAGLIYSDELEESVKTMRCAVLASGNDILYDDFWAGLNLIHERIGATNE